MKRFDTAKAFHERMAASKRRRDDLCERLRRDAEAKEKWAKATKGDGSEVAAIVAALAMIGVRR